MSSPPSLESVWEDREERVYPSVFGPMSRGTFALTAKQFTGAFGQTEVDPRWLHHGVMEFGPTAARNSWVYVTTGTSNPWEQEPDEYSRSGVSGIGTELVLEVAHQSEWAIGALAHLLAYNILLAHGRLGDFGPLRTEARFPLGGPIDGDASTLLTYIVIGEPTNYPHTFVLDSGRVEFLQVAGITESEWHYGREFGSESLLTLLLEAGAFPVTDPKRRPVA